MTLPYERISIDNPSREGYNIEKTKEGIAMSVNIEYLWKDRKRYFGLPISFTRYSMSEDRLFVSVGFLNIKDDEILLYRVRDIDTSRTLWQRIFGVGTVTVMSSDKSMPNLVLQNIKDPMFVKELIHKQVEEMKIQRRVRVGEIMTTDMDGDGEPDLDDEV
ncbi:MAG: PH domain-containing protein [Oscillospiraceae bacterium]|nr:PH domain-containing protein [Oscillospiraceae bacterium]